jgi:hypothetical protein
MAGAGGSGLGHLGLHLVDQSALAGAECQHGASPLHLLSAHPLVHRRIARFAVLGSCRKVILIPIKVPLHLVLHCLHC